MGEYFRVSKHQAADSVKQLVLVMLMVAACSGEKSKGADSPSSAAATEVAPAAAPVSRSGPGCEHTGLWAECSLERRLKQSGFVVRRLDEKPSRAGFSVKPVVYALGSSRLEAFFYESESALSRDLGSIDTVTVAPAGSTASWPSPPTWIRSANLAAVFMGQSARTAERAMLAITAGPPQPGSPR